MIGRRDFVAGTAALLASGGCELRSALDVPLRVARPGMREGHWLRDRGSSGSDGPELRCDVAVLGSGVAGLTAAWKLTREGRRDVLLLTGPEYGGNASAGRFGDLRFPRGAHYLPLPSIESSHARELLSDLGVIESGGGTERPRFDESALVHAPDERLLIDGAWQDGLVPPARSGADADAQRRFFELAESLRSMRGDDGRRVFAIPVEASSSDPKWRALDAVTFDAWLDEHGYRAPTLRWYLDYCCRDDYGAGSDRVSAWAGLHYFAARASHASNAGDGAVLTWPDGLGHVVGEMASVTARRVSRTDAVYDGFATRIVERRDRVEIDCATLVGNAPRRFRIVANRAVCAMPLHVAARVVAGIEDYGYVRARDALPSAPWIVASFLLDGFPEETDGAPLSWDNVLFGSGGLGYVVATHQDIRAARPARTVFTTYRAIADVSPTEARRRLELATDRELRALAGAELERVYGWRIALRTRAIDIAVRAHAMSSPVPGFLSNAGHAALRAADGRLSFAHSDLSGLSLFEEASYWGYRAATRILAAG